MAEQILTSPDEHIAHFHPPTLIALGPPGTFSDDMAHILYGGSHAGSRPTKIVTTHDTFESIRPMLQGDKHPAALLPLENSSTSPVGNITDMLISDRLSAYGEATLIVELVLAALDYGNRNIKRVYSHPKAFGQALGKLATLQANREECGSTAAAAVILKEKNDLHGAVLCSARAAHDAGLKIIQNGVQDDPNNRTRFVVVQSERALHVPHTSTLRRKPDAPYKAQLLVEPKATERKNGWLHALEAIEEASGDAITIKPFGTRYGVNSEGGDNIYLVECEGRAGALQTALDSKGLAQHAARKIIGLFPRGHVYRTAA